MGAFAVSAALVRRNDPDFEGEWIDIALFETLYRLIEWQVIFYDQFGVAPARAGNQMAVAPGAVVNTFATKDDVWITVTSATPRSVRNIAELLGEPLDHYQTAADQAEHKNRLDSLLTDWIAARTADDCLAAMKSLEVVASRIFSAEDIVNDPTYLERGDIITIDDPDLGPVRMQGVVPQLHQRPGRVWRVGPKLGQDNDLVYRSWLGYDDARLGQLRGCGVI
jgi:formyl-CoA transferase